MSIPLSRAAKAVERLGFMSASEIAPFDEEATQTGGNLLTMLGEAQKLDYNQLHRAYAMAKGYRYADLEGFEPEEEALRRLPADIARQIKVIPYVVEDTRVTFATARPTDPAIGEAVKLLFPDVSVAFAYAPEALIQRVIDGHYSAMQEARTVGRGYSDEEARGDDDANLGSLGGGDEDAVVKILSLLVEQAYQDRASDIHIEPNAREYGVRFRIDGDLVHVAAHDRAIGDRLVKLVKVRASMDHGTSLKPESGGYRATLASGGHIDFRVEATPVAWGDEVVMRLQEETLIPMSQLGFSPYNLERYTRAYTQPWGMIMATGPTGSGKSTTGYATLNELRHERRKIITLENPIEIRVPHGVSQTSINDLQGLGFGPALRSSVRRDPDILMVGEIRDSETASIAVDAALTGHLLLSTLHTNDAPGAVGRLRDLGIQPFLLAETLLTVVAQRLIKRLCDSCKEPLDIDAHGLARLGYEGLPDQGQFFSTSTRGCEACRGRGTKGRTAIHEVMYVDEDLRDLIGEKAPLRAITAQARKGGMTSLRQDGLEKAALGLIDPTELATKVARDR